MIAKRTPKADPYQRGLSVRSESLGDYLRRERLRMDLTQDQLADRLGVSHTYISHLEAGRRVPSIEFLSHFADVVLRPVPLTISPMVKR